MTTLYERARSQDGNPIPRDLIVLVELIDPLGNVIEYQELARGHDAEALARWVGDYVVCMAAEGMAGSVRWSAARTPVAS